MMRECTFCTIHAARSILQTASRTTRIKHETQRYGAMKKRNTKSVCPCGGLPPNAAFADCCEPLLEGRKQPGNAEQLMRSRYTAYTLGRADYLSETWHASTRPVDLQLDKPGAPHGARWLGLVVRGHQRIDDAHEEVSFTARWREQGRAHRMTETSRFLCEDGKWYYVDGDVSES